MQQLQRITFCALALSTPLVADTIEVSQETMPGSGQYVVLGEIQSVDTAESIASLYGWSPGPTAEYNGAVMIPALDQSVLFVHRDTTSGELSLVVLHDDPDDSSGGTASTQVNLSGDMDGGSYQVLDDDPVTFTDTYPAMGPFAFEANQSWGADRGDGFAIGGLTGSWVCEIKLTSSSGLTSLVAGDLAQLLGLDASPSRTVRLRGRYAESESFCPSSPNSTGSPALAAASGSFAPTTGGLTLSVTQLPGLSIGYFLMSATRSAGTVVGDGLLCLGQPQGRFIQDLLVPNASGSVSFDPDLDMNPLGASILPGSAWHFQFWFRDANPGWTTNTSQGVTVFFAP